MITRADKEQEIKLITEKFGKAKGAFIVDFKGIKVEQVTNLRKKLNAADSEMKVVRNTLAKRAFKDHPSIEKAFTTSMKGTNAIVFSYGEVNATAKTLADFAKDVEVLQIKSGVMDGEALDDAKIKFLATLPGKDQLRAMFLGTLLASGSALARCLNAYAEKLGGGATAGTEEAPQA
ncbi:50S ribosomal protein L10 [Bdellovibrio sp. SKB1291214]|uniref:50S ribosomal protein L10 n=1 Tax=Bdellovibrio sp. SKB1291214 TaxID=1732569 RepID=UPI0020CB9A38|nr:50S ribosomal protein L10 [Bdellovibrio sp. SKB1291214]UYL08895.1 50S ribosomal protein L10 [Bdellovibrio sp. SKB1291214]